MDAEDNIKTILIWTQQIKPMDRTHLQAKDQNHGYLVMGISTIKDGLIRLCILLTYNLSFHDILICFDLPTFLY